MDEIIYYESEDANITITDSIVYLFGRIYSVDDIKSGQAIVLKPDQMINYAIALIGIVCVILGKIRSGSFTQIANIEVLFHSTNYFELGGFILILIALMITLPQAEKYGIQLIFKNGENLQFVLHEKKYTNEVKEIEQAILQALRFAEYKKRSQ